MAERTSQQAGRAVNLTDHCHSRLHVAIRHPWVYAVLPVVLIAAGTCDVTIPIQDVAPQSIASRTPDNELHPFILLTNDQIQTIRDRTSREPAKKWLRQLERRVDDAEPIEFNNDAGARLQLARDLAMRYVLTADVADADRAARILADTPLLDEDVLSNDGHHAFVSRVPRFCEAYDLLRTHAPDDGLAWTIPPDTDATIRNHIAAMARWLRDNRPFWYDFTRNNWAIRQYAALTLCTMTIAEGTSDVTPDELKAWYRYAYDETLRSLDVQICDEGAFAEGCSYMNYSAENTLPMFFALRNLLQVDLFAVPRFRTNFEWLAKIRTPAGYLPNFDDAPLSQFPVHYLTSAYENAGRFAWDWQRAGSPVFDLCRSICWHDDRVVPEPPKSNPCIALPESGNAVLRNSWEKNALYLLLLGEHGQARTSGFGHEHPDNTSFLVEAFGEPLAIDSGYIDFANHTLVNKPECHNLILVDNAGPAFVQVGNQPLLVDQDAFLEDAVLDGPIPRCSVRTSYAGMALHRTVFMPGHDHFIIVDTLHSQSRSARSAARTFSWLMHGNAGVPESQGGTGGTFELTHNSARWTRPSGVSLNVWLASSAGSTILRERFDADGETYRHQLTGHGPSSILRHRTMEGVASGDDIVFLAIVAPAAGSASIPEVVETSTNESLSFSIRFPLDGRAETVRVLPRSGGENPARPDVSIIGTAADGTIEYELHPGH